MFGIISLYGFLGGAISDRGSGKGWMLVSYWPAPGGRRYYWDFGNVWT